jgi:hypothetical protein
MTSLERRALYNSLRQNWLQDPSLAVDPWQVEDYRRLTLDQLFQRLKLQEISFDKLSFQAYAEQADTPEELTEFLLEKYPADPTTHDQVYLLVFELWRRLIPEKPSLTIFCDELDHQITRYDQGEIDNPEAIEDLLSNLQIILEEHADDGGDSIELFETVCRGCANDVESFLYDFIAEQIDANNFSYASELLDAFSDYATDIKWFDFLKMQILFDSDPAGANQIFQQLLNEGSELEFNLELLAFMVLASDQRDFVNYVVKTASLLVSEEDFQDLLTICLDFYHRLDDDDGEKAIQAILTGRSGKDLENEIDQKDPGIAELFKVMSCRLNAID